MEGHGVVSTTILELVCMFLVRNICSICSIMFYGHYKKLKKQTNARPPLICANKRTITNFICLCGLIDQGPVKQTAYRREIKDNGYKSVFINSWLVRQSNRSWIKGLGKNPQKS